MCTARLPTANAFDYTAKASEKDRLQMVNDPPLHERGFVNQWTAYRRDNARSVTVRDNVPDAE